MKKVKFLVLALVMAVALVGAGYAYWSDQLTVTDTVTTGIMNVEFIQPHFTIQEQNSSYVVPGTSTRDAKTVTFSVSNMYPGAKYYTISEMQNKGTIPAKFDNAVVTLPDAAAGSELENLLNNVTINFDAWIYDKNGNHIGTVNPTTSDIPLKNLQTVLNQTLANVQLEPGAYMTLQGQSADQWMEIGINNALTNAENMTFQFSIQTNWKQHNQQ